MALRNKTQGERKVTIEELSDVHMMSIPAREHDKLAGFYCDMIYDTDDESERTYYRHMTRLHIGYKNLIGTRLVQDCSVDTSMRIHKNQIKEAREALEEILKTYSADEGRVG